MLNYIHYGTIRTFIMHCFSHYPHISLSRSTVVIKNSHSRLQDDHGQTLVHRFVLCELGCDMRHPSFFIAFRRDRNRF